MAGRVGVEPTLTGVKGRDTTIMLPPKKSGPVPEDRTQISWATTKRANHCHQDGIFQNGGKNRIRTYLPLQERLSTADTLLYKPSPINVTVFP